MSNDEALVRSHRSSVWASWHDPEQRGVVIFWEPIKDDLRVIGRGDSEAAAWADAAKRLGEDGKG